MWKVNDNNSLVKVNASQPNYATRFYQSKFSQALISTVNITDVNVDVEIDTGGTLSLLMHISYFPKVLPESEITSQELKSQEH